MTQKKAQKLAKDNKLIKKYFEGDEKSFEALIQKYLNPVFGFICQLTKDSTTAEDLTQETFFKAWKSLKKFDKNKNFKTWLFTIARNTTYDFFKKKKTIPFSFFNDDEGNNKLENIKEEKSLPDEDLQKKDFAQNMNKKINKLPKSYQVILTLHYREDFSLTQIAKILNKPYNTIKSQHRRGLKKLKKILER